MEIILSFLRLYSSATLWTLEEKLKAEGKGKMYPFEWRVLKNSKER